MNYNEIYIAIPRAIIDIYRNGFTKKSEALGMFFVKPELEKGMFGKLKITGFKEAITDEKIANRIYYNIGDNLEPEDVDCM